MQQLTFYAVVKHCQGHGLLLLYNCFLYLRQAEMGQSYSLLFRVVGCSDVRTTLLTLSVTDGPDFLPATPGGDHSCVHVSLRVGTCQQEAGLSSVPAAYLTPPGQLDHSNGLGPPFFSITPNPATEALRFCGFWGAKQAGRMSSTYSKSM